MYSEIAFKVRNLTILFIRLPSLHPDVRKRTYREFWKWGRQKQEHVCVYNSITSIKSIKK